MSHIKTGHAVVEFILMFPLLFLASVVMIRLGYHYYSHHHLHQSLASLARSWSRGISPIETVRSQTEKKLQHRFGSALRLQAKERLIPVEPQNTPHRNPKQVLILELELLHPKHRIQLKKGRIQNENF